MSKKCPFFRKCPITKSYNPFIINTFLLPIKLPSPHAIRRRG
nr:MAG TPA: hypothetical protein [Caudoviricetes sp.]